MGAIFISYRREDSEGQAGRLYDDLAEQFGPDAVFMDVAGIEPGRDFRRVIDERVSSCAVLLAVIGRGWLAAADERGKRRLDDTTDFVRLETASALRRDIPVVPVLVHGARMPRAEELPDDLVELAYRNGVELTHARWASDVQVLVKALKPYVVPQSGASAQPAQAIASESTPAPAPARLVPENKGPATPSSTASPSGAQAPAHVYTSTGDGRRKLGRGAWAAIGGAAVVVILAGLYFAGDSGNEEAHTDTTALVASESSHGAQAPVAAAPPPAAATTRAEPAETTQQPETPAPAPPAPYGGAGGGTGGAGGTAAQTESEAAPEAPPPQRLRWRMGNFPPPNAGKVLWTITPSGDPACMSFNGSSCAWGVLFNDVDFSKVRPLVCGAMHKAVWGATGYEDPKHWCSLARNRAAAAE